MAGRRGERKGERVRGALGIEKEIVKRFKAAIRK